METVSINAFRAGRLIQDYQYQAFVPSPINTGWTWDDPRINTLLEEATVALGELSAFSRIVPDVDLFISLHVIKEASESSRIEGTVTEMDEALRPREEIEPERRDDWEEVQNYIRAMNEAVAKLEHLPLSNRLLKETHQTLMEGVRGEHKTPGEWRKSQNWIGGTSIRDAVFIPPPHSEVPELMSDLEKFWHNDRIDVPHLIRVAISHYQFETIHPFLDGNGRLGRLLITLYLIEKRLLTRPTLYLSSYLGKNKAAYYDALTTVRASNDLGHWLRFFLQAVRETARRGSDTFARILDLRRETEARVVSLGPRADKGRLLLNLLYRRPIVSINEIAEFLGIGYKTAGRLVSEFERLQILVEVTGFQRNRLFSFEQYYRLFIES